MEREVQKGYWMEHSKDLTVEAMMLDSRASDLDKEERPEVIMHRSHIGLKKKFVVLEKKKLFRYVVNRSDKS